MNDNNDWRGGKKGKDAPPDLEEIFRNLNQKLSRLLGAKKGGNGQGGGMSSPEPSGALRGGLFTLLGMGVALWLATGFYVVDASEVGVVLRMGSFSLGRWSSRIPTEFLVFRRTQDTGRADLDFAYGAITLCCATFQLASAIHCSLMSQSYNPKEQALWFGLFPFRSPLLRESNFLSLPAGNEMFQFPACSSIHLCIQCNVISYQRYWVAPFGNLRIKAYLQLPGAYRC